MSLITGIIFNSCNSNKTTSNKEELDTVWNEKVQNSFYDLKLGTPTSVEQIVNSLENMDSILSKNIVQMNHCILDFTKANILHLEGLHGKC